MKALLISGGGARGNTTMGICEKTSAGMKSSGLDTEIINLSEYKIFYCEGCSACRDFGECHIDDDMDVLFRKVSESDILILATPVRFSGPSAMVKTFMERFQPCWYSNDLKNTEYFASIICGGSETPNFDNVVKELRAFSITLELKWTDVLKISGTDSEKLSSYGGICFDWGSDLAYRLLRDGS